MCVFLVCFVYGTSLERCVSEKKAKAHVLLLVSIFSSRAVAVRLRSVPRVGVLTRGRERGSRDARRLTPDLVFAVA